MTKAKTRIIQITIPESIYQLLRDERALSADGRSFDLILLRYKAKAIQFRASLQGASVPKGETE